MQYFSKSAKSKDTVTAKDVGDRFVKENNTVQEEEAPKSDAPFDPRPLHVILTERKAMIDASFDEYYSLKNRIAKVGEEDYQFYQSLADSKAQKEKRIREEEERELRKFKEQLERQAETPVELPKPKLQMPHAQKRKAIQQVLVANPVKRKKAVEEPKLDLNYASDSD
ncbi:hypothetical protein EDD86DRAFT_247299 [Gorgonomyces haynaldii]|nr:hypothetical protein EDD86DRAFT_247299 [Gorgonomyces haynaldii]